MRALAHGTLSRISTLCLSFEEIPKTAHLYFRPTPEGFGFDVETNLDFKSKNVYSQCTNVNIQGIYLQVNYQGSV